MHRLGQEAFGSSLKVALVHSFYSSRNPSGENAAVLQQAEAMRRAGYEVEVFAQRTDERELRRLYPIEAAITVSTGIGYRPQLGEFEPDVIHIHNLFPNYGTNWIRSVSAPVVSTIHNYRPLCAAGTFYRMGESCTDCLDGNSSLPAVVHGCYRGRLQSVPVSVGQRFANAPVLANSDALIVLSEQMREMYARAGVPWTRMHTLPNFLPQELDCGPGEGAGGYWLYAGRLSEEKGVLELLRKWPKGHRLILVGAGDLEEDARSFASDDVEFLGAVDRSYLLTLMKDALGVVFPSRCFEGFPLIYPEALSAGTPILTWAPNVVSRLVASEQTGLVGGRDGMVDLLGRAHELFPLIRRHCRSVYEEKYTEREWIPALGEVYKSIM